MAEVRFERIYKVFGSSVAVEDLNLVVPDGEFLVMVGPSGCGKTTSLRMLAGLERPSYGRIFIGPRMVNTIPAKNRDVAMVFQSYALYPHKSVYGNLAWGMKVRKEPKEQIRSRVSEVAELLGITQLLDKRPATLSGGERQRVALGRALLRSPQVFLMDEPLSNLDAALRVQMRKELIQLHTRLRATMVYVTHDQVEAMTMGTRIAVMAKSRLQQVAAPEALYDDPSNLFVATFIGSPKMNIVGGSMRKAAGGPTLEFLGARTGVDLATRALTDAAADGRVLVGFRPEDVHWEEDRATDEAWPTIEAQVEVIEPLGSETYVTVRSGEETLVARFPPRTPLAPGDRVRVAVDFRHLHVFDPGSQDALLRRKTALQPDVQKSAEPVAGA